VGDTGGDVGIFSFPSFGASIPIWELVSSRFVYGMHMLGTNY